MEAILIRDQVKLWDLRTTHPDWTIRRLAEDVQHSNRWVKKWLRRFRESPPEEDQLSSTAAHGHRITHRAG